ncbi:MAG: N-6 DNA methylase [Gomphosphaeria aponina SAG 52.96 = DSM 107014]|uniref:site-specific DNA-methyltransferase (adenine-specific) n=1 Tax=Gomphosphaeria aponina SAG 52.96 = DSM 107014 TaxID=1521640 RepID=A0A941GP26_9CHRO|nr:N-6 DNA methylase [Gomphosphaeria aponina SAG 52.96 = DSM 107014]
MILEKEYIEKISLSHRKKFAQFFTPEPIAQIMVNWLLGNKELASLLEPAFGLGIFSRLFLNIKKDIKIQSFDIDPVIFTMAKQNFNGFSNVNLFLEDYLFSDWNNHYNVIICNPPYLKFHDYENKRTVDEIKSRLKINLSGLTNIYTLFLLKSVYQLKENGRIAYLVPSEFLNSDYGKYVKEYLLKSNTLRHIIIFDFKENIFSEVSTTSAILLLAKDNNYKKVHFSLIENVQQLHKISTLISGYPHVNGEFTINREDLNSNIKWRTYYQKQTSKEYHNLIPFNYVAKVVRGIATGANDYFIFNKSRAREYQIRENYLLPCITKSKDINKPFFTKEDFQELSKKNADIYLFNAGKNPRDQKILNYINYGELSGVNKKYLTSKRNPWYSLENRTPSPIWVGVFNRTGLKFIRNEAGISNLTTFHCIYIVENLLHKIETDLLFAYLLTDVAKQIFNDNRREYGDGLKKFEPNDLNNALMLDLSKLKEEKKREILDLFAEYRKSVINNNENIFLVDTIDKIFKSEYKI